jgi:hypothetical protein
MICEVDGNEYEDPDHQSPHPYSLYLCPPQIPQKPESLPFDKNTQMQFFQTFIISFSISGTLPDTKNQSTGNVFPSPNASVL